jgi:hypothetical protein
MNLALAEMEKRMEIVRDGFGIWLLIAWKGSTMYILLSAMDQLGFYFPIPKLFEIFPEIEK